MGTGLTLYTTIARSVEITIDKRGSRGYAKAFDSLSRCRQSIGYFESELVLPYLCVEPRFPHIAQQICCAAAAQASCSAKHARTYAVYRIMTVAARIQCAKIERYVQPRLHQSTLWIGSILRNDTSMRRPIDTSGSLWKTTGLPSFSACHSRWPVCVASCPTSTS